MSRTASLKGEIFGKNATTTIPSTPTPGVAYRNTSVTGAVIETGLGFSVVSDSRALNEILYRIGAVLSAVEQQGILEWSALTDYPIGGFSVGSTDKKLYKALIASGPNSGGTKDCDAGANPTYWSDVLETTSTIVGANYGMTIANATDVDHDITIAAGRKSSFDQTVWIDLASAMTKQIDAAWTAGTNAGGLPGTVSLTADTWYHVFVIKKTSNGSVDAGFDTSVAAANLLTASGYDKYKRVGSVLTDSSSNIIAFAQIGNRFYLDKTSHVDRYSAASAATGSWTSLTLTVPDAGGIIAMLSMRAWVGTYSANWDHIANSSVRITGTTNVLAIVRAGDNAGAHDDIIDTSVLEIDIPAIGGSVDYKESSDAGASGAFEYTTIGWIDTSL